MSDAEVATRAPESDAAESVIPGDTKVDQGPTSLGVSRKIGSQSDHC